MTKEEEKNYYKNIGRNLRFYRNSNKLTLAEIGKVLGVSAQQIQKYETGNTKLPAKYLFVLSQYYNIDLETLISINAIPEKQEPIKSIFFDIEQNIIAKKLKTFRKLNDKTQANVAEILEISFQQYQKYETGQNRIPIASLHILANAYNVSLEDLITENEIVFSIKKEPKE